MDKTKIFFFFIFFLFLFFFIFTLKENFFVFEKKKNISSKDNNFKVSNINNDFIYGIWIWQEYFYDSENVKLVIDFAKKKKIRTFFVRVDNFLDAYEAGDIQKQENIFENLNYFVKIAHQNNIKVEALFGGPQWSNPSHRYLVNIILDFILNGLNNKRINFDGIHIDIEPYQQDNFSLNSARYYEYYLTTIEEIKQKLLNKKYTGTLSIDIPYWFGKNNIRENIFYNKKKKNIFKHLLDILEEYPKSYLVIMAYRNYAFGNNGVINILERELSLLNQEKKYLKFIPFLVIGQEITEQKNSKTTSYYGYNWQYIYTELFKIDNFFRKNSEYKKFYKGIALHDFYIYWCTSEEEKNICRKNNLKIKKNLNTNKE